MIHIIRFSPPRPLIKTICTHLPHCGTLESAKKKALLVVTSATRAKRQRHIPIRPARARASASLVNIPVSLAYLCFTCYTRPGDYYKSREELAWTWIDGTGLELRSCTCFLGVCYDNCGIVRRANSLILPLWDPWHKDFFSNSGVSDQLGLQDWGATRFFVF